MSDRIDTLLAMLRAGQDSALLRFSLGNEYLGQRRYAEATEQLQAAVELDRNYSAAWKLLGRALLGLDRSSDAQAAYTAGIAAAETNGDMQAAKEMKVFLRRLQKNGGGEGRS